MAQLNTNFVAMCPVSDESYLYLKESFHTAKKKKSWKGIVKTENGERKSVTHRVLQDEIFFVYMEHGEEILLISETMLAEDAESDLKLFVGLEKHLSPEEFNERMLANSTGNHRGKTHKVRVKTPAGQPVRG